MSNTTVKTTKKWTRAKVPRVRTGCLTCKSVSQKRHIKCDERKPTCKKCEEGKWTCDGYELNPTRRRLKTKAPVSSDVSIVGTRGSKPAQPLPILRLTLHSSETPTEMELLYHVRTCTVQDLASSLCRTDFWQIYALPLGHVNGPVKSAMCALGSAHKYFKSRQSKSLKYLLPPNSELNKKSIEQYNLAISQINSLMNTPSRQNTETILMCCIIFMCIENLQGRYPEYIKHFRSATAILASLLDEPQDASPSPSPSPPPPTLQSQLTHMKPNDFYAVVLHLLFRVGQDLAIFTGGDMVANLNLVVPLDLDTSRSVTPFTSALEADNALFSLQRAFDAKSYAHSVESVHSPVTPTLRTTEWLKSFPYPPNDGSIPIAKLKPYFDHWNARFNLFREQLDENKVSKLEAESVKRLALVQGVWTGLLRNKNVITDFQREDAEEILRRAESLVSGYAEAAPVFNFDGCLIPCMMILFTSCEHTDLQKRCIGVLRSAQRREGIWDAGEMADILEAIMLGREQLKIPWHDLPWHTPQLAKLAASFDIPHLNIAMGVLSLDDA